MNRTAIAVVTIIALSVFTGTLIHALWFAPEADVPGPPTGITQPQSVSPDEYPTRLQIPSLSIDANVQYVGVNSKGNMGVPNNFTDVAWYKYGTVPGYRGSAVIDGHVDNGLSLPGVFKHLGDIKVGDDIYVIQKNGTKLHFVVDEIESYPYKNVDLEKLFNRSDTTRLNLVTCEGNWVKGDKTYDQRLIIYSDLVS